ncbi:MAG: hypothetical protein H7318_17905 [Oligoflexus sp.]|nr:hypothetical protein [Oligoflexus sp.]
MKEVQNLDTVRGKILMRETFELMGSRLVICASTNLSLDNVENQIFLTALKAVKRLAGAHETIGRRNQLLLSRMPATIGRNASFQDFCKIVWGRHNGRYRRLLYLAKMIMSHSSYSLNFGDRQHSAFLINLASLFEKYVARSIASSVRDVKLKSISQKNLHLDLGRKIECKPDILLFSPELEAPVAVLDTKYKDYLNKGMTTSDGFQMVAYMLATNSDKAWLVYPEFLDIHESLPLEIRVENKTMRIYRIGFETSIAPEEAGRRFLDRILASY